MTAEVIAAWSGSAVSSRVLDVAAESAERRGSTLRVVLGWDFLDQPGGVFDPALTPERVNEQLEDALAPTRGRHPGIDIVGEARMGWAPSIIAEVAEHSDVLVVGRSEKTGARFGDWSPDVLLRRVRIPVIYVP